jgi:hypothetical protein
VEEIPVITAPTATVQHLTDPGNDLLAPTEAMLSLDLVRDGDLRFPIIPARASMVPAKVEVQEGNHPRRLDVVIWTIRTPVQTFTLFVQRTKGREWVTKIRDFMSSKMPLVIYPDDVIPLPDDTRRLQLVLKVPDGSVQVILDATTAASWVDLLDRAVSALSGLVIPGQS